MRNMIGSVLSSLLLAAALGCAAHGVPSVVPRPVPAEGREATAPTTRVLPAAPRPVTRPAEESRPGARLVGRVEVSEEPLSPVVRERPVEEPRLVTWPSPVPLPREVESMWRLYQAFAFDRVIESAMEYADSRPAPGYALATACTLAAASAYLRGDLALARRFVVLSHAADPDARPDPSSFPGAFCRLQEVICTDPANETGASRGLPKK